MDRNIKKPVLPNLIYRFKAIPIKIPSYSGDINKLILKYIWKENRPRITNITLQKNKVRGQTLPTSIITIKLQ